MYRLLTLTNVIKNATSVVRRIEQVPKRSLKIPLVNFINIFEPLPIPPFMQGGLLGRLYMRSVGREEGRVCVCDTGSTSLLGDGITSGDPVGDVVRQQRC